MNIAPLVANQLTLAIARKHAELAQDALSVAESGSAAELHILAITIEQAIREAHAELMLRVDRLEQTNQELVNLIPTQTHYR